MSVFIALAITYFISMFIYPWIDTSFDWVRVQQIWSHWQTLNAGILALVASIIALTTTSYQNEKQRERDLIAEKIFLTESLNELTDYYKSSANILLRYFPDYSPIPSFSIDEIDSIPATPLKYRDSFARCIKLSPPTTAKALSFIILWIPIHECRLDGQLKKYTPGNLSSIEEINIINTLYNLGILMSITNKLYGFCRYNDESILPEISEEDIHQAFYVLSIDVDNINELNKYIQHKLPTFDYNLRK